MVRPVLFSKVSGTYESQRAWSFAEWDPLVIQSLSRHLGISLGKRNRLIWNLCFSIPEKGLAHLRTLEGGRFSYIILGAFGYIIQNKNARFYVQEFL